MNPNLMVLPPLLSRTGEVRNIDFQTEFPEFCKRFATPSPPQACLQEASTSVPITKPNVVNEFLTRQGAIGRMNVFRSIGEDDIPLPGLNVSSVLIQNLGYEVPLEEYDQLLNTYVAYCFLEYKLGKVSKGDLVRLLQEPMTTILAQRNKQRPERFHLFSPSDPGFVVTVQDVETEKNYRGGRKSRRTRRRHNRKRASRRKH